MMPRPRTSPRFRGFEIQVRNETDHPGVSEKKLVKVAAKILRDLGFKKATVSILLVGGPQMRRMNQRYLKHAWSTDVLAFAQGKIPRSGREKKEISRADAENFLGDIVLGVSTIEGQAEEYGHTFEEELNYCLCHGILHLLGHTDKTRPSRKRMHRKQKQILKRVLPGT